MAGEPSYPGVYIEEVPLGVPAIEGVATSVAAFVGRARRGPVDAPVRAGSFGEYERAFGGLWSQGPMGHAVAHFFQNGGREAVVVRVASGAVASRAFVPMGRWGGGLGLELEAASPGTWGDGLRALVRRGGRKGQLFDLYVREFAEGADRRRDAPAREEVFRGVSFDPGSEAFVGRVAGERSELARVIGLAPAEGRVARFGVDFSGGDDGSAVGPAQATDPSGGAAPGNDAASRGIYALRKCGGFDLLVIPPFSPESAVREADWAHAAALCRSERAVLLIDPEESWGKDGVLAAVARLRGALGEDRRNAAIYFPWVRLADPLAGGAARSFPPAGAVAGVIARTDAARGVWKAPAGLEAGLSGVVGLAVELGDVENGELNPQAVNCLRSFAGHGAVVWGSRTLDGADGLGSEWKYLPVRRLALFLEESLHRGTEWAVFEPNGEPLWARIRQSVGAFMLGLFRQGALQGTKPEQAWFVKCDSTTMTQADIDRGVVNLEVGFAPLKPAEFVVLRIQQATKAAAGRSSSAGCGATGLD